MLETPGGRVYDVDLGWSKMSDNSYRPLPPHSTSFSSVTPHVIHGPGYHPERIPRNLLNNTANTINRPTNVPSQFASTPARSKLFRITSIKAAPMNDP